MKNSILFNETPEGTANQPPAGTPAPDVTALQKEVETLRAQATAAQSLQSTIKTAFTGQGSQEERIAAVRTLLKQGAQMADDEIEAYLNGSEEIGEPSMANPPKKADDSGRGEQELEALKLQQIQIRRNMLRGELDRGLDNQLQANKDVSTFFKKVETLRGAEGAKEAQSKFRKRLEKETILRLEDRKRVNRGHFDERWVGEEMEKAAKEIVDDHLSAIGDLDRIGRAPETVTGAEQFLKTKPKPAPVWDKGYDISRAERELREYNKDALMRLAASTASDGKTKV